MPALEMSSYNQIMFWGISNSQILRQTKQQQKTHEFPKIQTRSFLNEHSQLMHLWRIDKYLSIIKKTHIVSSSLKDHETVVAES